MFTKKFDETIKNITDIVNIYCEMYHTLLDNAGTLPEKYIEYKDIFRSCIKNTDNYKFIHEISKIPKDSRFDYLLHKTIELSYGEDDITICIDSMVISMNKDHDEESIVARFLSSLADSMDDKHISRRAASLVIGKAYYNYLQTNGHPIMKTSKYKNLAYLFLYNQLETHNPYGSITICNNDDVDDNIIGELKCLIHQLYYGYNEKLKEYYKGHRLDIIENISDHYIICTNSGSDHEIKKNYKTRLRSVDEDGEIVIKNDFSIDMSIQWHNNEYIDISIYDTKNPRPHLDRIRHHKIDIRVLFIDGAWSYLSAEGHMRRIYESINKDKEIFIANIKNICLDTKTYSKFSYMIDNYSQLMAIKIYCMRILEKVINDDGECAIVNCGDQLVEYVSDVKVDENMYNLIFNTINSEILLIED